MSGENNIVSALECLPTELLLLVADYLENVADLASLLLVNTSLNIALTPRLYSAIELRHQRPTINCLHTLSTQATSATFMPGRDLASLVLSLHIAGFDILNLRRNEFAELQAGLEHALPRLTNMRKFTFKVLETLRCRVLVNLLASWESLSSVDVEVTDDDTVPDASPRAPAVPHLTSLGIRNLPSTYDDYLQQLAASCCNGLLKMSLAESDADTVKHVLGSTVFAVLQDLELEAAAFFHPDFPHGAFPSLQALVLSYDSESPWDDDSALPSWREPIPYTAYPQLESLACNVEDLPLMIPKQAKVGARIPVHTIRLNGATYERNGGAFSHISPEWDEIVESLSHLRYSGVPIRHLSFHVYRITVTQLEEVLPSLEDLESLMISSVHDPSLQVRLRLSEHPSGAESSYQHLLG